jgi:uncharacterized membrane protein YdbT with pleckstrin-like domain
MTRELEFYYREKRSIFELIKDNKPMGNYIQENLIKDEKIEFETTYHWIIFCNLRAIFTLFIAPMLDRYSDEFAITNKRIIVKTGLISRKTLEMNLNKIESVNVDQSILGRMLGYGTIRIIGTGGTREEFPNISNPIEFRKKFQELS